MLKETYRGVDTDMSKIAVKLQGQIPFFFFLQSNDCQTIFFTVERDNYGIVCRVWQCTRKQVEYIYSFQKLSTTHRRKEVMFYEEQCALITFFRNIVCKCTFLLMPRRLSDGFYLNKRTVFKDMFKKYSVIIWSLTAKCGSSLLLVKLKL